MRLVHVEDDIMARELVKIALQGVPNPPALLTARSVAEAIAILHECPEPVAVLSDHTLTDGTVHDVLAAVEGRPAVGVVVVTGVMRPETAKLRKHPNVVAVFEKPMGLTELEAIIEVAIAGPRLMAQ